MSTPHNQAPINSIAKTVIMPGDPLRAKYIAEKFLTNCVLVNDIRGILTYTGTYKDKNITIMASGMGIPSMGIYAYELYKFYNVENIIRIGSCGAYIKDLNLFDIVLSNGVYSESNYAYTFNNDDCHFIYGSEKINNIIQETAKQKELKIFFGNTVCIDCFDPYMPNINKFLDRLPKDLNPLSAEMEAFSLFYIAKFLNKNASCLMSVVDSKFITHIASPEEREKGLDNMIILALESSLHI